MSTLTSPSRRLDALHPMIGATAGAATFALAMMVGEVYDLNSDGDGASDTAWGDIAAYVGLVLSAMLVAVWLGVRARAGTPRRLESTALGLAIAAAVLFVAFWSGWPHVFAGVAAVLALEHRRRVGSFSAMSATALVLGAITFVTSTAICVLG